MSYIERVLPSLGEESVTLRSIGAVAADVVAHHAATGSIRRRPRRSRAACGWPGCCDGWSTSHRRTRRRSSGSRVKGHVLVLPAGGAGPDPRRGAGPPQAQPRPRGRREGAAGRAVASPPAGARSGAGRVRRRWSPTRAELRGVLATPGGRPSARPAALSRLADRDLLHRLSGSVLSNAECDLLSASYADLAERPDWTVADGALLDELVHLLGPLPAPEEHGGLAVPGPATPTCPRWSPRRTGWPACGRSTRSPSRRRRTRTSWSTRRRTSRRCSGGCCAGAGRAPAGPSSATRRRAPGPTRPRPSRALTEIVGTAPVRRFRMSTNYRSPAEVFDLAAKVVVAAVPSADLPQAVRSVGVEPRAGGRRARGAGGRHDRHRGRAAGRGRGHGRRDRSAGPQGRRCRHGSARRSCPAPTGSAWWPRWRPRAWSTTRCWWSTPDEIVASSPGRGADALRGADPADPAAGHARRRTWCRLA